MGPGDLSAAPEAAAQPGPDPGPGQAEHATENPDDPFAEYTPAYSSGSFTEFIEATSEADIPPFSAEPLPDAVAPDAYGHPAPEAPVNAAPGILGYDEPAAATGGVPDAQESAPDAQEYDEPDVPGDSVLDAQESAPDAEQYDPPAALAIVRRTPGSTMSLPFPVAGHRRLSAAAS